MGCACPDQAKALLSNELHREWGTTAAKYRARYLISGLKSYGTWTSKARALSHRLEDDARRLADRAALATSRPTSAATAAASGRHLARLAKVPLA
ncbi:methyltransferase domain-containing protein [Aureococcus anophagefferens]|nr:methyltransferase domain-containing protein [Aureococcus anophagefferens]